MEGVAFLAVLLLGLGLIVCVALRHRNFQSVKFDGWGFRLDLRGRRNTR